MAIKRTILSDNFSDETEETTNNNINTLNLQTMAAIPVTTPIASIADFDAGSINKYFKNQSKCMFGTLGADAPTTDGTNWVQYVTWQGISDVLADSTTYSGSDAAKTEIKTEAGSVAYVTTEAGTIAFDLSMLTTSSKAIETFLNGSKGTLSESTFGLTGWEVAGFGSQIPTINTIFAIVAGDNQTVLIIPNAEVIASLLDAPSATNGLKIKLNVTALKSDKPSLITGKPSENVYIMRKAVVAP